MSAAVGANVAEKKPGDLYNQMCILGSTVWVGMMLSNKTKGQMSPVHVPGYLRGSRSRKPMLHA